MSAFSASRFLEQAARHQATHASLFAAPMRMILARGAQPVGGLQLRHCWYAQNVTDEQYAELARLFGCLPRQLYGMTETIPAVLTNRALLPRPDAMGVPTLGCDVDLAGVDDGGPVPDGEVGEIVVRGIPGVTLFAGYLDDPETTARSFRGDAFLTGDRAWRDDHARFYFAGRGGDILKVSGENVSVVEVEAVLAAHPAVFEAAVIGEPDPIRDEVPVAYVVLAAGAEQTSVDALAEHCAQRLAPGKRPRRIEMVPELPRTSVGKVRKFLLPQLAASLRAKAPEAEAVGAAHVAGDGRRA
jgi:crotonobetaine/carnitine-CoA ligase